MVTLSFEINAWICMVGECIGRNLVEFKKLKMTVERSFSMKHGKFSS
jgi:hypothetical protein